MDNRTIVDLILNKTDYDSMAQIANGVSYVNDNGYMFGLNILGALFFAVPRSIWPGKPIDTGSVLAQYIRYPNENLSAPLWGEAYLAFGLLGVVGLFVVAGYLLRRLYARSLIKFDSSTTRLMSGFGFCLPPLAVYEVLILRGSLLQAMARLVVLGLVLFLCTKKVDA